MPRPLQMQSDLLGENAAAGTGTRELNGSLRAHSSVPQNKVKSSQDELRAALSNRGTDTLVRLGKKFFIMDDDRSNGLSYEEVCTLHARILNGSASMCAMNSHHVEQPVNRSTMNPCQSC